MADEFRLPSSSLTELKKIIQGYARIENDVQLDQLERLVGIRKQSISTNNPALTQLGLIEGGNKKNVTPLGKSLGRALEHEHKEDISRYLREMIEKNEFLSGIVTTVRIQKGYSFDSLADQILYASGQTKNKNNLTGARAYCDLLLESGLLVEKDGLIVIATPDELSQYDATPELPTENEKTIPKNTITPPNLQTQTITEHEEAPSLQINTTPTKIVINIQLQIPAVEDATIYENLFKALRKNLLTPSTDKNDATE